VSRAPTDWTAVVAGLDRARSLAYNRVDPTALRQVYAPGSDLLRADQVALQDLQSRHVRARGLGHRVLSATVVADRRTRVELDVAEQLTAYALVDSHGVVLERHTGGPVQRVVMVLDRGTTGWRVLALRRGP
jgi:hypothetical protein